MSIELAAEHETQQTERDHATELRSMKVGDRMRHDGYHITRVMTGFIYRWEGAGHEPTAPVAICFVPYSGIG